MARRLVVIVAAIAAAALVAGGCGAGGGGRDADKPELTAEQVVQTGEVIDISGTDAVGESVGGSVAPLVECRDWNEATEEEKLATIEDVRSQVSRQDVGIDAPVLSDEEAMTVFDSTCEPSWAQGFRLYKLYARAVAFAPLARQLER
jgi:hypothetical protein